jgi:hypothetical protein
MKEVLNDVRDKAEETVKQKKIFPLRRSLALLVR